MLVYSKTHALHGTVINSAGLLDYDHGAIRSFLHVALFHLLMHMDDNTIHNNASLHFNLREAA